MIIGTIQAFNEVENIRGAVESLLDAGCNRVVVVDGAWALPDGGPFGGCGWYSTDGTAEEARAAGAEVVTPLMPIGGDGDKRDLLLRVSGAGPFDNLLLLDADERIDGRIDRGRIPAGHACVILRNDKPNDLEFRTPWLDPEIRVSLPMLRWFRWSPDLRCVAPGKYVDAEGPIRPYLVEAMAAKADGYGEVELAALAALRSVEFDLPNESVSLLPVVPGIEISHCVPATEERVQAKEAYYGQPVAA